MKHLYLLLLLMMPAVDRAQVMGTTPLAVGVPVVLEAISADRPGFGFSTDITAPGVRQVESGLAIGRTQQPGSRQRALTLGSPLLRMGLSRRVELRVGGQSFTVQQSEVAGGVKGSQQGWSDFGIGSKVALVDQTRRLPAVSGLVSLSLPTGTKAFTSAGYDASAALGWSKNLPAAISVGGASGLAWVTDSGVHHGELSHSLSMARTVSHGLTPYGEVAYDHSRRLSGGSPWMMDGGSSRSLGRNLLIDAEYGRSLASRESHTWFVSGGCSFRMAGFRRPGILAIGRGGWRDGR